MKHLFFYRPSVKILLHLGSYLVFTSLLVNSLFTLLYLC